MMQNFRFLAAILLIAGSLISCHKDSQIGKSGNNNNQPKYYIKSFASSLSDSTTYSYDAQLRLTKKVVFSPSVYRINSIDSTIYLYSYNNKEQLDTITTKISNGSSWVIGYQTCQYNSDGRLYQLNYLTQSLILENYWLIAYNNKGQIDSTTFMIDSVN